MDDHSPNREYASSLELRIGKKRLDAFGELAKILESEQQKFE